MNYYTQLVHQHCSISIYLECIAANLYTIKYVLEYTEQSVTIEPRGYIKAVKPVKPENSRFDLDLEKLGIKLGDCKVRQELTSY